VRLEDSDRGADDGEVVRDVMQERHRRDDVVARTFALEPRERAGGLSRLERQLLGEVGVPRGEPLQLTLRDVEGGHARAELEEQTRDGTASGAEIEQSRRRGELRRVLEDRCGHPRVEIAKGRVPDVRPRLLDGGGRGGCEVDDNGRITEFGTTVNIAFALERGSTG